MAKSCLFSPVDNNGNAYKALPQYKKALGTSVGSRAFLKALSPGFQERNKDKLEIDEQGVATLDTALKTSDMKEFIGFQAIIDNLEKKYNFIEVSNNSDNYRMLVNDAKTFNDQNPDYIAYPEITENGIRNIVHKKNTDTVETFNNQYGSMVLNDRLLNIFKPLGLTVSDLSEAEKGYTGIVDFKNAKFIAGQFIDLIKVSNNLQGQMNMSEEFAHLIIRMLKDKPLIVRLIGSLAANQSKMQNILGDDYALYIERFSDEDGNVDYNIIAEECLGRLLQQSMLNNIKQQEEDSYIKKLWKRAWEYIKKLFNTYNYKEIENAVLQADQTIDALAKSIISGSLEFTKSDISNTISNSEMEMQAIKEKAISDGTFMKAPNGKPTNLNERQWLQVRTKTFKKWFGDWENDPANASKVVDENGEPLVVYHGSKVNDIRVFKKDDYNSGYYFTSDINYAKDKYGNNIYSVFLNIKNPVDLRLTYKNGNAYYKGEKLHPQAQDEMELNHKNVDRNIDFYLEEGHDGIFGNDSVDTPINGEEQIASEGFEYVVFNPNQIKSATDNIGTFDDSNPDIMYHLEKNVEYLQDIVQDAIATEKKKKIIVKQDKAQERAQKKIDNLEAILDGTPAGKLKGIINYAHAAAKDLGAANEALGKVDTADANFSMLRGVRSTIQSYNDFFKQLGELINSQDDELSELIANTSIEDKNHTIVTLKAVYDELASLNTLVRNKFKDVAFSAVENFFKPFFSVEGAFIDRLGRERSLDEIIKEADGDIGFIDMYLITMGNSSDILLQLFNAVIKKAKANARYSTIEDLTEITQLMLDAEEMGIKDFDWIYERDDEHHKTGNYISAINMGQYEKDRDIFFKQLEEEYGINPTGAKAKEKKIRRKAWRDSHGKLKPNSSMYHNSDFDKLNDNQRKILDRFMQLKQKFDKRLPPNKTSASRAIQMRRTGQQRFINSLSNPSQTFQNIKESIAKELTKSSDDDAIYGEKTSLRSFDGSEFKVLPALYTHRLSNPEELTSDIFSALAAYSYSTNTYKEMDKVVDPLEVAKDWVNENRKVKAVSNNKELVEKKGRKNPIINAIFETSGSNISKKLEDCMDSQVYQRYYADSDKTINVMGREIKAGKIFNKWMSLSSTVQLGFNALSWIGNASTGIAMQNIEALCGHYFNAKELFKADMEYGKQLMHFIPEIESKNPKSKIALFDQKFDIKQEFGTTNKNRMNKLFEKVFGKSLAFFGQTCGDHWLYNRTAIAMCLRKKVKTSDGSIISLWEALHVENAFSGDDRIKKLVINAVDAETGEVINDDYIHKFSEKINEINHRLFGVYNTDDMVAAQRVALGRAVLQYRQWIVPMFARRFQKRIWVEALGEYEEGYYRTLLHLMAGLRGGKTGWMEVWNELDEPQRRNVYRALIELAQYTAVAIIANFVDFGDDDPDRFYGLKMAEYMAQRELHELGNLAPSLTMGNEILKTVKSPATFLNTTQAALNLTGSLLNPMEWNNEIESGKYEGMSTLHKNILKAPFPILAPFNQFDRLVEDIEDVTRYYARPY